MVRPRCREIRAACGSMAVDVQHAGRTSVSGLPARPIRDMVSGVHDPERIDGLRERMESLGCIYRGLGSGSMGHIFVREFMPDVILVGAVSVLLVFGVLDARQALGGSGQRGRYHDRRADVAPGLCHGPESLAVSHAVCRHRHAGGRHNRGNANRLPDQSDGIRAWFCARDMGG